MIADYFEALTGYREWNATNNGVLLGVSHSQPWPTYKPVLAACNEGNGSHLRQSRAWIEAPVMECTCGIYCFKERPPHYTESLWESPVVWGSVKVWGRVIEHEAGYRAEYAYPHELNTSVSEFAAARIAQNYGVPCLYVKPKEYEPEEIGPLIADRLFFMPNMRMRAVYNAASAPATYPFWRNQANPTPPPAPPPIIHTPTLSQIKAIGASRFQRNQQMLAGRRGGGKATEWRAILRRMIFLNPDQNT